MKISNCPICGKIPTYMAMTFTNGERRHSISCSGMATHTSIRTSNHPTKKSATEVWNTIVRDVKQKTEAQS